MDASQPADDQPPAGRAGDVRLDSDLMNALAANPHKDERSLEELMVRHRGLVTAQLRHYNVLGADSDDVGAKVWLKVWEIGRDGKFDSRRGLDGRDPFVPLLKTMCYSLAIDFHRKEKRRRRKLERIIAAAELHGASWRDSLVSPSSRKRRTVRAVPCGVPQHLERAVAELPPRLRRVYELHCQGLKNREISTLVGCSDGETSKRLKKAREALSRSAGPDGSVGPPEGRAVSSS